MASAVDMVTLDNFASKLPPWNPDLPNHLYALVDVGSNGIRFSISDLSPPSSRLLKCLYRERAAISLFDALNEWPSTGPPAFSVDVIARVSRTIARFRSIADDFSVPAEHIAVFATEAMRKASNAVSMLSAIRSEAGLGVYVLAPEVETLFGAMGARSGFTTVNGLFLDLGGGSLQMTYMNSATKGYEVQAARTGKSLPFGAARLINILENETGDVRTTTMDELYLGMQGAFARLQQEYPLLKDTELEPDDEGIDIYLCGGGFRGYGSILMHHEPVQPYPIPAIGAYTVSGTFFQQTATMRNANIEYEGKIFGMSKRRRRQFPAIASVVEALIVTVPRIRTVTFCSGGIREGALALTLPEYIREAKPLFSLRYENNDWPLALGAVTSMMESALPSNIDFSNIPTVLTLGLGPLFASEVWARSGEPSEANASFQLHQSLERDPSLPGFTHLGRSVLALTLCFRWSAALGPIDQQLFQQLQGIVRRASPEAITWAEYIGKAARLLSKLCPRAPKTQEDLEKAVKYSAKLVKGKNKTKLQLTVTLSDAVYRLADHQEITNSFKDVSKPKDGTQQPWNEVQVFVEMMQS
ncbi:Ppx/GppA phosphatase family-domain-containing protein [Xylaria sp. CBS 124048]|nr:Ppx/GppA phosphatase family-domain-containing protein [Xylaria sp. CBS 124048]